jgi:hypothetical protein
VGPLIGRPLNFSDPFPAAMFSSPLSNIFSADSCPASAHMNSENNHFQSVNGKHHLFHEFLQLRRIT